MQSLITAAVFRRLHTLRWASIAAEITDDALNTLQPPPLDFWLARGAWDPEPHWGGRIWRLRWPAVLGRRQWLIYTREGYGQLFVDRTSTTFGELHNVQPSGDESYCDDYLVAPMNMIHRAIDLSVGVVRCSVLDGGLEMSREKWSDFKHAFPDRYNRDPYRGAGCGMRERIAYQR